MIDSFSSMKLLEWVCTSELFAVYNVVVNSVSGRSMSIMVRLDFTLGVNGVEHTVWPAEMSRRMVS